MKLVIEPDGVLTALYSEELGAWARGLGGVKIVRASQVDPDETGDWYAKVFGGPALGPFGSRAEAVRAEVAWLEENRL